MKGVHVGLTPGPTLPVKGVHVGLTPGAYLDMKEGMSAWYSWYSDLQFHCKKRTHKTGMGFYPI